MAAPPYDRPLSEDPELQLFWELETSGTWYAFMHSGDGTPRMMWDSLREFAEGWYVSVLGHRYRSLEQAKAEVQRAYEGLLARQAEYSLRRLEIP